MSDAGPPWVTFEWATVRVVPRIHQSEFVNVGVIVHARTAGFLDARIDPPWQRIAALAPALDRDLVERHLAAYLRVCRGEESAGPVALSPPSERFHWLTAPRSAVVQTSEVHPGVCRDPGEALDRLAREQLHR